MGQWEEYLLGSDSCQPGYLLGDDYCDPDDYEHYGEYGDEGASSGDDDIGTDEDYDDGDPRPARWLHHKPFHDVTDRRSYWNDIVSERMQILKCPEEAERRATRWLNAVSKLFKFHPDCYNTTSIYWSFGKFFTYILPYVKCKTKTAQRTLSKLARDTVLQSLRISATLLLATVTSKTQPNSTSSEGRLLSVPTYNLYTGKEGVSKCNCCDAESCSLIASPPFLTSSAAPKTLPKLTSDELRLLSTATFNLYTRTEGASKCMRLSEEELSGIVRVTQTDDNMWPLLGPLGSHGIMLPVWWCMDFDMATEDLETCGGVTQFEFPSDKLSCFWPPEWTGSVDGGGDGGGVDVDVILESLAMLKL